MITTFKTSESKGFYTPTEAARIARIPNNTLRDWRKKRVLLPTLELTVRDGKTETGYDFQALLLARLLRMLRQNHVGLRRAVATLRHCITRFGPPGPAWAEVKVFSFEGADIVTFRADEWDSTVPTKAGQKVAEELFGEDFASVKDSADALLIPREFLDYVQIDPDIRDGLPVVRGTRIKTSILKDMIDANWTPRLIVDLAYPHLTDEQVENGIAYERFLDGER